MKSDTGLNSVYKIRQPREIVLGMRVNLGSVNIEDPSEIGHQRIDGRVVVAMPFGDTEVRIDAAFDLREEDRGRRLGKEIVIAIQEDFPAQQGRFLAIGHGLYLAMCRSEVQEELLQFFVLKG
jgi:hypothetical protein